MLQNHPGLVAPFTHLRLGPIAWITAQDVLKSHYTTEVTAMKCKDHGTSDAERPVMCLFEAVATLLTLAHNLKAISTSAVCVSSFDSLKCSYSLADCHKKPATIPADRSIGQAESNLQSRLEEITVEADYANFLLPPGLIMSLSLADCSSLKRLVVPYESLFQWIQTNRGYWWQPRGYHPEIEPSRVLPPSLESVHLGFGIGRRTFPVTQWLDRLIADDVILPKLRQVQLQYSHNVISTAWGMCVLPNHANNYPASLQRWQASRVKLTTTFGTQKFREDEGERQKSEQYTLGDLASAIKKCLTTTHDQLEKEPEMMAALGYVPRPT